MLDDNKYQKYFDEFNNYSAQNSLGSKYLDLGQIIITTKYYQIIYYRKLSSNNISICNYNCNNRIFLVIPSIFNSPEILLLAKSSSFINKLRQYGEVFLVDWFEVDRANYLLDDYVLRIIEIITDLRQKKNQQLDLIGHCIGGNLALAATVIEPNLIRTLTLLSTPWDFSHLTIAQNLYNYFNLDNYVQNLPMIPKLHMQILFFLLLPNYFNIKLDKFFSSTVKEEIDLSFRIENWLMSGTAISNSTYKQIMNELICNNILAKLRWRVNNRVINPALITRPVYQVTAVKDRIAPKSSILPLHNLLQKSKVFEVPGGHISYLINDGASNLFMEYLK